MNEMDRMLADMNKRVQSAEAQNQQMERRIKELEEQTNSLGIIEPGQPDFLISGDLINTIDRNIVDEDDADSVFADKGAILNDGTGEQIAFLKFAESIQFDSLQALIFADNTNTLTFAMASRNDGGNLSSYSLAVSIALIIADYDPTLLTFNNKPDTTAFKNFASFGMNLGFADVLASEGLNNPIDFNIDTSLNGVSAKEFTVAPEGTIFGIAGKTTRSVSGTSITVIETSVEFKIFGTPDPSSIVFNLSTFGIFL